MDDDNDFTFCQVGQTADKEHSEAQVALLNINDIRIKDDFSNGGGDSQIDTLLWKDKPLDDVSIKKQETVGSLSFNVINMSTPKIDLPKQTTTVPSEDSGKNSQEKMTSTRKPAVRAKVPFEKGYSQMDWLKLTRTHPDLAGLNGQSNRRLISIDEVKQHRTGDSIWTVLKGRVYNIAPYMKFHPGGVDMLMKAAGKDCTSLFNKYHAWVNAEFMLEKCLVGTLDESR